MLNTDTIEKSMTEDQDLETSSVNTWQSIWIIGQIRFNGWI